MDIVAQQQAQQAAAKRYERMGWRVVSRRGQVGTVQSNGTDTTHKSRTRWVIVPAVTELKLVFANFYLPSGNNEPSNAYTVTFQAAFENPTTDSGDNTGASVFPIFFGGKRSGVMEASAVVESDPFIVNFTAAGRVLWLRCSPTVTSGDKWVNALTTNSSGSADFSGGGVAESVVVGSSVIDSGAISPASITNAFAPVAILGRTVS